MRSRGLWRAVLFLVTVGAGTATFDGSSPVLIDDFDDGDRLSALGTGWVIGGSPGNVAAAPPESNPLPDPTKAGRRLEIRARLTRGTSQQAPSVMVNVGLPAALMRESADRICGITFRFSGSGSVRHVLQAWTPEVQDGCHFEAELPASDDARVVSVQWRDFHQPRWGRQGPLRPAAITGLQWVSQGADGADTCLTLDDVAFTLAPGGAACPAVATANRAGAGSPAPPLPRVEDLRWLKQKELRFLPRRVEIMGAATVPVAFGPGGAVVEARLNGQGPFRLVFDSGAEWIVLTTTAARRLGLKPRGRAGVLGFDADAESSNAIAEVEEVSVGGFTARGVEAAIVDLVGPPAIGLDGVLALGVMDGLLVTLDGPAAELRIERGELRRDAPDVIASGGQRIPEVTVAIGAVPVRCHLDTGAGVLLSVTDEVAKVLGLTPNLRPVGWSGATDGRVRHNMLARFDGSATLSGIVLERPIIGAGARYCTLGEDFFRQIVTTFDMHSHLVRMLQPGGAPITSPPARSRGFYERWECGRCVVADVLPGSPAEAAGLATGATITSLDGVPVAELGVAGVRERMTGEAGVHVGLEGGREFDVAKGVMLP